MRYQHILAEFQTTPWAILPEKLVAIRDFLLIKAAGGLISADAIAMIKRSVGEPLYFRAGAVPHEKSEGKDDSGSWDGPAAVDRLRKWASSDGSGDKDKMDWAKYAKGFAWYDSADKENFGSYKLPHHDVRDGKFIVVFGGVQAAMNALLGGRGGVNIPDSDRKAVYNHLASEYKEFGKEPPEYHGESSGIEFMGDDGEYHHAAAPAASSRSRAGSVAVLPLMGTISNRMGMISEMSGGTSAERFTGWLRAAVKDPNVKAIVIDADSPGGTIDGVPELADEIYKARDSKPICAVANTQAASAAYWLCSQAGELCVSPSAQVGSIGVFAAHEDLSKALEAEGVKVSLVHAGKYKTEGNPFEPLSDDARQALQSKVDDYYNQFVKDVARGRGVTVSQVRDGFGQGRMVSAQQAVKDGMADRVATLDQTLARLGATTAKAPMERAEVVPSTHLLALRERELQLFQ